VEISNKFCGNSKFQEVALKKNYTI